MRDRELIEANTQARALLEALIERLSPVELSRSAGGGWTVATILAHLAFWDRYHAARWRAAQWEGRTLPAPLSPEGDELNAAVEPFLVSMPVALVAGMAVSAAREIDGLIAGLPAETLGTLLALDPGDEQRWLGERYPHRREHIAQIERALRGS